MGFIIKEVEIIIPPKNRNTNIKTIKVKPLNGHDAIRKTVTIETNTSTVKSPVQESTKPETKVSIGS